MINRDFDILVMLICTTLENFLFSSMICWMAFMNIVGFAAYVDKCKYCTLVVETFKAGMKKTENQHFAGGNTDWEERKLGKFAKSETRLVEIMEHLCKTKYLDNLDEFKDIKDLEFKCQQLVEEHEESIENWYFHKQLSNPDFLKWLCYEKLRLCCNAGHYGANCKPCPGVDKNLPVCSGHGFCQGDGSREGNGKCKCDIGYVGSMCSNCDANYYAIRNSSTFSCNECHKSCRGGCTGGEPRNCKECHAGWIMNDSNECEDVNECLDENLCTGEHMKCNNTEGSYECICDKGFVRDSSSVCKIDVKAPNTINGEKVKNRKSNGNLDNFDIDIATRDFENPEEGSWNSKFESEGSHGQNNRISRMDEL